MHSGCTTRIMRVVDVEGLIEDCRREVDEGGFFVMALIGDELGCDWAYTIGLHHNHGHPELLVAGLDAELCGAALELLGNRVVAGERVEDGAHVTVEGGLALEARTVDPLFASCGDWFVLGREVMSRWGQRWPESLQLVWSDDAPTIDLNGVGATGAARQPLLFTS